MPPLPALQVNAPPSDGAGAVAPRTGRLDEGPATNGTKKPSPAVEPKAATATLESGEVANDVPPPSLTAMLILPPISPNAGLTVVAPTWLLPMGPAPAVLPFPAAMAMAVPPLLVAALAKLPFPVATALAVPPLLVLAIAVLFVPNPAKD